MNNYKIQYLRYKEKYLNLKDKISSLNGGEKKPDLEKRLEILENNVATMANSLQVVLSVLKINNLPLESSIPEEYIIESSDVPTRIIKPMVEEAEPIQPFIPANSFTTSMPMSPMMSSSHHSFVMNQ